MTGAVWTDDDAAEPIGPAARGFATALVTQLLTGDPIPAAVLEDACSRPPFGAAVIGNLLEHLGAALADNARLISGSDDMETAVVVARDLWARYSVRLAALEADT